MDNQEFQGKSYMPVSRLGSKLIDAVGSLLVFSKRDLRRLLDWKQCTITNVLSSSVRKGIISRIKRDRYVLTDKIPANLYRIAVEVVGPAYVSFWTALSLQGYTEQQVHSIQLVTTKKISGFSIMGHRVEITTLDRKRFFGYSGEFGFAMASKEKLLVDCLYMPDKAGGIGEVKKLIKGMWSKVDKRRLLSYIRRFHNKSINARLGYLLEELGLEMDIRAAKGMVKLNPRKGKGAFNKRWGVVVNDY